MINVYSKGTTTFNNNGLATLIPLSCEVKIDINGAWQLTLEHPFDKEKRYAYLEKDAILRVTGIDCVREWTSTTQFFRIYDTKKTLTSLSVIAFPLGMEATYDAPIESLVIDNKTGVSAASDLDSYVKNHDSNNKYTLTSNVTRQARSQFENTNLIAAISGSDENSFVNKWGGEVVYDNYQISIKNIIGDQNQDRAYPIRYGRNLTGLTHEIDASSVITRLYPLSSDDLRLNGWEDVTSQGGTSYYDTDASTMAQYPFIRCAFVDLDYSLIDTNSKSHSRTADATETWRTGILNAVTTVAQTLWTNIKADVTNTYSPAYIQDLIKGKDGISEYLQRMYVFTHKGWQSFVKSQAKQGVEWIDSATLPNWEWHEDTTVEPHAWWYGDDSTTPSTSYAKNCYVKIGKYWEYFNDDGFWLDYRRIADADMEIHESQVEGNSRQWFGSKKKHYAHNEYVYCTVSGVMQEWWYDSDGWYDADSSGDSDFGWHQDSYGWWFGEEDASTEDKNKYLHDCWRWIDGNYYWFDQYGYANSEDPELYKQNYEWGEITDDNSGKNWFGNPDENYGVEEFQTYLKNQWAKIDGEWYYFDSDGYMVDMTAKKSSTIAWFATSVYNGTIDYIKTCLTAAYTLLYEQMEAWCQKQYDNGLDSPSINISVDLVDLSKTSEYSSYVELERIALGDKVLVVDRDNNEASERVLGLTYDCLRGYNTKVEVGGLSKSVSQIIKVSYKDSSSDTKMVAGDNVVIDGKVISVTDYVGRAVGIQDVLMDGISTLDGNVASFGFAAGEKISLSRSGNIITINSTGGDGDVSLYHGIEQPDASLGDNNDIYIELESQKGTNIELNLNSYDSSGITGYGATPNYDNSWTAGIVGRGNGENQVYVMWSANNLTVGKEYTVTFDWDTLETPSLFGIGRLFGITIQHNNNFIDMQNYTSEMVENGVFKHFENQSQYGEFWYQSFYQENALHSYEFKFVAKQTTEYIGYYLDRISGGLTTYLRQFGIGLSVATNEIKDVYYKVNGEWLLDDKSRVLDGYTVPTTADGQDNDLYCRYDKEYENQFTTTLDSQNNMTTYTFASGDFDGTSYESLAATTWLKVTGVTSGKTYHISYDGKCENTTTNYVFRCYVKYGTTTNDARIASDASLIGSTYANNTWYPNDNMQMLDFENEQMHSYDNTFTATDTSFYIGINRPAWDTDSDQSSYRYGVIDFDIHNLKVYDIDDPNSINLIEIYEKKDGEWHKFDGGNYEAGENITIEGKVINAVDTTYSDFTGATSQADGVHGLVPAPTTSDVGKVLGADGTWVEQSGGIEFVVLNSPTAYNNLTPAQKMDVHKAYVVKNWPTTGGLPLYVNNDGELSQIWYEEEQEQQEEE